MTISCGNGMDNVTPQNVIITAKCYKMNANCTMQYESVQNVHILLSQNVITLTQKVYNKIFSRKCY